MKKDLLEQVQECLRNDVGRLVRVAEDTGIPYDTILRIKNAENDPLYSKVRVLGEYYSRRATRKKSN
jgi:hypothetical protein